MLLLYKKKEKSYKYTISHVPIEKSIIFYGFGNKVGW